MHMQFLLLLNLSLNLSYIFCCIWLIVLAILICRLQSAQTNSKRPPLCCKSGGFHILPYKIVFLYHGMCERSPRPCSNRARI